MLTLTLLGALGFGGGVWYSRIDDTFHDFFTEYVPYGEQAVLYLEEMDFRKRFPNAASRVSNRRDASERVKIPAQSGASWRVADHGEPAGRQSSAVPKVTAAKGAAAKSKKEDVSVVASAKEETAQLPKVEKGTQLKPTQSKEERPSKVAADAAERSPPAPVAPAVAAGAASVPAPASGTKPFKVPEVHEP